MNLLVSRQIGVVFIGILAALASPQCTWGDISLPKIFSDHMVFQRNARVKIWGKAEAGEKLTIKLAGKEITVTVKDDSTWSGIIETLDAGGPYVLEIAAEKGEPKVMFSDVMVGEVWVCSGQSNMELSVSDSLNAKTEIELSKNFPLLRLFTADNCVSPQPLRDFSKVEPWSVCSPETVKDFSAVAYFFGREVNKELKGVAIGLIDISSMEGTVCEAWISQSSMKDNPEFESLLKHANDTEPPNSARKPASLFNSMVAPMTEFRIRGVLWYQGEANIGRGEQYSRLFPTLIQDWRKAFGESEMPFFFVQLTPFRYKNQSPVDLPEVWDAQLKTLKNVPNTGMAVTTDIGNADEFKPKNKQEVGRRLALIALANIYKEQLPKENQNIVFSGPIFLARTVDKNRIELTFNHASGGLKIRNDENELNGFTICGKDQKFVPAIAKINGNIVEVSSPDVENPTEIRFGWDDTANPNLINGHGLPASPFRTDDFPLSSKGREF